MKACLFKWCIFLVPILAVLHAEAQRPRNLVLVNGTIYTVEGKESVVQALSIVRGKIAEIGTTDRILAGISAGTQVIDLHGRTVVPGFIDAHGHLLNFGLGLQQMNFVGTTRYQEIVDAVALKAESLREGEWITGRGWDQNDWPRKTFPNHGPLSRRSAYNPVALTRIDGHALLVNEKAMEIAGIDRDTADPPGGRILQDENGEPTGMLVDRAMGLVTRHIPPHTGRQRRNAIKLAIRECQKYGLTSVHDAGVSGEDIELYKAMIDSRSFDLRVYAMIRATNTATVDAFFESGPLLGYGADRLTVRSIKAMTDGALGSRGAALLAPYSDDPENSGLLITRRKDLDTLTQRALRAGFQVATHSIGDRGNRVALNAYEDALKAVPKREYNSDARLRIEHAQVVTLKDISRFASLGVIPSMQATHATSDMYWAQDRLGRERIKGAYAWRRFLASGSRIANGSDFPVESANPLWGFYASITRQDHKGWPETGWRPAQRMSREEALRSFTLDAAYAAFEEDIKGSIEKGKLADLVVLSRDIMQIPPKQILETHVVMTILGGKIVYRR